MSKLDIVGKSYPQIDGMQKAMGKTKFVTDLVLPGMLSLLINSSWFIV